MLPDWWPSDKPWIIGDFRDYIPNIPNKAVDLLYLDPIWPNCTPNLCGKEDAEQLFLLAVVLGERIAKRMFIHLGCDTDPRLLKYIPEAMPFQRVFWLEYCRPHYKGRILYTSDVGYLYGELPKSRPGNIVIPGFCLDNSTKGRESKIHPCPRKIAHVKYIVTKCSNPGEIVLDPFLGSGTTLLGARMTGREGLGIEVNGNYLPDIKEKSMADIKPLEFW